MTLTFEPPAWDDATLRDLAEAWGVCVRPLMRRVTDLVTGEVTHIPLPCGSTREAVCQPCAAKARRLRAHQCAEGWHLMDDPLDHDEPADPEEEVEPDEPSTEGEEDERRVRSTRRRQDVPDLPRVPVENRTVGTSFTGKDGRTYRPSMFVTLTLPSYGKIVTGTGVPADPSTYNYRRAALDALHFPKLVDRWWQNLRRCAGYKVQYFAAVEPQRRLAPHLHTAVRGAIPRQTLRQVAAATYVQLWWPAHETPVYVERQPLWDRRNRCYRDPDTGVELTTWDDALTRLDEDDDAKPAHVMRFGRQLDIQGIIAPSDDATKAVRYLTKYLTKSVAGTYANPDEPNAAHEAHIDRLHAEVRWLPCTPACANWLRYGIQPKDPGPGLVPGRCPSPAHDRDNLGLGGRRVLVSRHWSGKTLAQHRADRAAVVRQTLIEAGLNPTDAERMAADTKQADGNPRYVWETLDLDDHRDLTYRSIITRSVTQAKTWRTQYDEAKRVAQQRNGPVETHSATAAE